MFPLGKRRLTGIENQRSNKRALVLTLFAESAFLRPDREEIESKQVFDASRPDDGLPARYWSVSRRQSSLRNPVNREKTVPKSGIGMSVCTNVERPVSLDDRPGYRVGVCFYRIYVCM